MLIVASSSTRAPRSKEHRDHPGNGREKSKDGTKTSRSAGHERRAMKDIVKRMQHFSPKASRLGGSRASGGDHAKPLRRRSQTWACEQAQQNARQVSDAASQALPRCRSSGCDVAGSVQDAHRHPDDDDLVSCPAVGGPLRSIDSLHVLAGDEDRVSCCSSTSCEERCSSGVDDSPLIGRPPRLSAAMRQITPEIPGSTSRVRSLSPLSAFEDCRPPLGRQLSLPCPSWRASMDDSCCGLGVDEPSMPPLLCSRGGLGRLGAGKVAWHSVGV